MMSPEARTCRSSSRCMSVVEVMNGPDPDDCQTSEIDHPQWTWAWPDIRHNCAIWTFQFSSKSEWCILSSEHVERRQAAILAANVAGHSRLIGHDEVRTFAGLKKFGKPVRSHHRRASGIHCKRHRRGAFMSERDYASYDHWKSWREASFFRFSPFEANYFLADFDNVSLVHAKFLEIGFGNGTLLSWAKSRGADIYGIEIFPVSIERAKKKNIPLLSSELGENLPQHNEFFDVVAVYDVLEHLSISEIITALDVVAKMLKPGGELLLRFPNGQSPFGRFLQHADHTHRSTLSVPILEQLTISGPLRISRSKSKNPAAVGPLWYRFGKRVKFVMRTVTEWYLKAIFDLNPCDLGTNVVIRLTKQVEDGFEAPYSSP
jgi:2-polyprenyl-3-methyl-5-hydroxy-6-metoxy-1,4-benzoquinol methylase